MKDDNASEDMSQAGNGNASIKKFFAPKLETVLKKLLNQMFLIDVNDLYKLKVDSEEYYENINHMGDEDCQLRVILTLKFIVTNFRKQERNSCRMSLNT